MKRNPQNIATLVGEIGESMVLFKLFELSTICKDFDHLEIFRNYSDSGYDVGIRNNLTNKKVRVEVKTRQRLVTGARKGNQNSVQFMLSENERSNCDFLIGYWLDHNDFFIFPESIIPHSNKILFKRHLKPKNPEKPYTPRYEFYRNRWDLIQNEIDNLH